MQRKLRAGRALKDGKKLKEQKQTIPKVRYLPRTFTRLARKIDLKDFLS